MRQILNLFSLFGFLFNFGCSGLSVPDVPIGRSLDPIYIKRIDGFGIEVHDKRPNPVCMKEISEPECGFFSWTVSDKIQFVGEKKETWMNGLPWSKVKEESLFLPIESMQKIKESFIVGCKKYGCSNADISKWRIKMDSVLVSDGIIF